MSDQASSTTGGTRTLAIERVFPHRPEKLWRALTEGPLLAQWLLENDFEPSVGRRFRLRADPQPQWDGVIDCEVLVVEPLKRLSYSWASMGLETVVVFTLEPAEGGTRLRMEQSGFRADQEQNYKGAGYGWQSFLGRLEKVVAGLG